MPIAYGTKPGPISPPFAALLETAEQTFATTGEITSLVYVPHAAASTTSIFLYSDQSGTIDVDVYMSDGNWRQIATDSTVGGTVYPVEFAIKPWATRVRWTPGAAPGTVQIDASYSGQAQPT